MDWRFCIQMCTVYCIYNVISIHHPNRITICEMYLFTGGESGRRAAWPRSRSDGEHHGEAAPPLLTNGLPSNLRRPIRPPSDQVEDLALLPPWWILSFCIFFLILFHPGHGDATSSTGNPFFANQFYPFQPGFSGHKMASDPLSRFLWLFSLKLLLFSTGRLLQKGGVPWMRAVCNSRLNLTLSYLLQPASSLSHSFDQMKYPKTKIKFKTKYQNLICCSQQSFYRGGAACPANDFQQQHNFEERTRGFESQQASSLFPLNINKMQVSLSGNSDGVSFTIETHNSNAHQKDRAPPVSWTKYDEMCTKIILSHHRPRWSG